MFRVVAYLANSENCHEFGPFVSRDAAEQTALTLSACGVRWVCDGVQLSESFARVVIEPVEVARSDTPEQG